MERFAKKLMVVNYFRKTLQHRYLTGFCIRLWFLIDYDSIQNFAPWKQSPLTAIVKVWLKLLLMRICFLQNLSDQSPSVANVLSYQALSVFKLVIMKTFRRIH